VTFQVGDKAKLKYAGFRHCPKGSFVKITRIMSNRTIDIRYKTERYVVSDTDLIELQQKEKVCFT